LWVVINNIRKRGGPEKPGTAGDEDSFAHKRK